MITIHIIATALSPITHMHGTAGNVALLQREAVFTRDGELVAIPCLSGNALRHALVRTPAAEYLLNTCGLTDISYQLGDFLFHGGKLTKASPLSVRDTASLLRAVPSLALLGGALPGQILEGVLRVSRAILICRESADVIERRAGIELGAYHGCDEFVDSYLYTRSAEANNPDAICDRMIYEGECVRAGAKFYMTLTLDTRDRRVIGCLLKALKDSAGYIGGMSRIGHGELSFMWASDDIDEDDESKLISEYENYVKRSSAVIADALTGLFDKPAPEKAEKPAKGKGKKKLPESELDFFSEVPEG